MQKDWSRGPARQLYKEYVESAATENKCSQSPLVGPQRCNGQTQQKDSVVATIRLWEGDQLPWKRHKIIVVIGETDK